MPLPSFASVGTLLLRLQRRGGPPGLPRPAETRHRDRLARNRDQDGTHGRPFDPLGDHVASIERELRNGVFGHALPHVRPAGVVRRRCPCQGEPVPRRAATMVEQGGEMGAPAPADAMKIRTPLWPTPRLPAGPVPRSTIAGSPAISRPDLGCRAPRAASRSTASAASPSRATRRASRGTSASTPRICVEEAVPLQRLEQRRRAGRGEQLQGLGADPLARQSVEPGATRDGGREA